MFPVIRVIYAVAVAILLLTSVMSPAQEVTEGIEEVLVLGSHIRRQDFVSASPVLTVESETIQLDGAQTLAEFLNRYPQFTPDDDAASGFSGQAVLNLRGLGANRSLIMLDGRRVAPTHSGGGVDINAIPTALVERVEILTGGASTVYGSDAVTGVVNIHLRRDYEGLELGGNVMVTDHGDGESYDLTLAGGTAFGGGRGHFSGFIGYTDRSPVDAVQRSFSRITLDDDLETGELITSGSAVSVGGHIFIPGFVNGEFASSGITFDPDGSPRAFEQSDRYNYQEWVYLQMALERTSAALFGEFELNDTTTLRLDLMAAVNDSEATQAPILACCFFTINTDNPTLTPQAQAVLEDNYDPGGTGFVHLPFGRRLEEMGPRLYEYERTAYRLNLGLDGRWLDDWRWSLDYTQSYTRTKDSLSNLGLDSRMQQALLVDPATGECFDPANGCVAANMFGDGNISPAAVDFIGAAPLSQRDTVEQQIFTLLTSGDWEYWEDWDLSMAAGFEWRKDKSEYIPDPALEAGDILGSGAQNPVKGDYDVWEVFAEVLLPLLTDRAFARELNLEVGYRYSDYSTVGAVSTYKGGISWRPLDSVLVRGMSQRAVRAPNLAELFTAQSEVVNDFSALGLSIDPCSASEDPVGKGYTSLCVAQGLAADQVGVFEANSFLPTIVASGGNTDLEAEEADTLTLGITWQPDFAPGVSLALDYYAIEIDNAITSLANPFAICFAVNKPESDFCQGIERGPSGDVTRTESTFYNVAAIASKGYDLEFLYDAVLPNLGDWSSRLRLSLLVNKVTEMSFQADPSADTIQCEGYFDFPCDFTSNGTSPEYRSVTNLTWMTGPLTTNLAWRWIDGMKDKFPSVADEFGFAGATFATPSIDSANYFDLSLSYALGEDVMFVAGVINLTDEAPPLLGFSQNQNNTIPGTYDTLGRRYHASVTMRF